MYIAGELAAAVRNVSEPSLRFGLYHSMFEWFNPLYLSDQDSDFTKNTFAKTKTIPELMEIVNRTLATSCKHIDCLLRLYIIILYTVNVSTSSYKTRALNFVIWLGNQYNKVSSQCQVFPLGKTKKTNLFYLARDTHVLSQ